MKILNFKSLRLSVFMLVMVIIAGGCKKKGPLDYFEETTPIEKEPQVPEDDTKKTKDPGTNIGDLGQVVFTYNGETVVYKTVRLGDGSIWLQQNMGSKAVATAFDDFMAYGDLFQSGRWDDGHQVVVRTSNTGTTFPVGSSAGTNAVLTPNDPTGLGQGIPLFYHNNTPRWWATTAAVTIDASKSTDVTAIKGCDPCKAIGEGWRLPTQTEFVAIRVNENGILGEVGISAASPMTNSTAFVSILKLTAAGGRNASGATGPLVAVGSQGLYWSSTATTTDNGAAGATFSLGTTTTGSTVAGGYRAWGRSIRCLKKL